MFLLLTFILVLYSMLNNIFLQVFTAIEDFVGKGKVSETCVFPFFGCISYVVYLNQAGEPQPVPSQLIQQPIFQVGIKDGITFHIKPNKTF